MMLMIIAVEPDPLPMPVLQLRVNATGRKDLCSRDTNVNVVSYTLLLHCI